jgi:hypothetical protein
MSLGDSVVYDDQEVFRFDTRILFVRHPVERLISTYSFYYHLNENDENGQHVRIPKSVTHKGWPTWVDFIIDNMENGDNDPHWSPFSKYAEIATKVININKLDSDFSKYWSKPVRRENTGREHLSSIDYRKAQLSAIYGDDLAIYQSVNQ